MKKLTSGFALAVLCITLAAASLEARPIHDAVCIEGCEQWRTLPAWRQNEITDRLGAIGADTFRIVTSKAIVALAATTVNEAGGAIAAPAPGSSWATPYVIMRNTTTDTVVQKVGHITFKHPGLDDVVVEPSVTFAANETKRIKNMSDNFDADWKQYGVDAHGLYVLTIDARIEATELLVYLPGTTKFELSSSGPYGPRPFTTTGQANDYVRIATDADVPRVGTYPTIFNTNSSSVSLVLRQRGPTNREDYVDTTISAPPGVSQVGVPRSLPNGGTLTVCMTGCGVGAPGASSPVYVFAVVGPSDGGTQGIRYAQPSP